MKKILILFLVITMVLNVMVMPVSASEQTTNVKLIQCQGEYDSSETKYAVKISSVDELELYLKRYEWVEKGMASYDENFFEEKILFVSFVGLKYDEMTKEISSVSETDTSIEIEIEIIEHEEAIPWAVSYVLVIEMDRDMPEKEIWVDSEKIAEAPYKTMRFNDVPDKAWYADAVYDVSWNYNIMTGTGNNLFEPGKAMTRGMLVTVLWRMSGEPKEGENVFTDVPENKYYTQAVKWAAKNGIVTGRGDGTFNPEGEVTREQMITILHRYDDKLGIDVTARADLSAFKDSASVHEYAKDAMEWAVAAGLIRGTEKEGTFYLNPQGSSTRAQVAAVLQRWYE